MSPPVDPTRREPRGGQTEPADLTGARFGRLVAEARIGRRPSGVSLWRCLCDCGQRTAADVGQLRGGRAKSCGCLRRSRQARFGTDIRPLGSDRRRRVSDGEIVAAIREHGTQRAAARALGLTAAAVSNRVVRMAKNQGRT